MPGEKKKLETSDFSRRCSIITSRCCVQVSTALCQNGINVPTHDDLFVSCYISNTLKVTFIPGNVKSLFKKNKKNVLKPVNRFGAGPAVMPASAGELRSRARLCNVYIHQCDSEAEDFPC